MTVPTGTRFGPYEVTAPLGAGGMGEVYLARDTRLGRDVAVKVLRGATAATPELRARFEREARTISSLNHPHICTLFDVGREGDVEFLVMERVEGETLAQRLARGPMPPAELLKLGAQIADALDRAHRAGIVHRDLKPGNVMLTRSGAKLMDFGLARAADGPGSGSGPISPASLTQSPTRAQPLTAEGTLVGTFQYMSPEQLEGKEADSRSDVWALGCVLYEMATGRRAFDGRSQASLISAIMTGEPATIAPSGPGEAWGGIDRAVRQCLAKDPEERWQSAGDLKRELEWIRAQGSQSGVVRPGAPAAAPARRGANAPLIGWAVGATLAAAALLWKVTTTPGVESASVSMTMPAGLVMSPEPGDVAISPDGKHVAFASIDSTGRNHLWIRDLDDPVPRAVPESETGCRPFWSPDGKWLAYFTGRERSDGTHAQLQKVALAGGAPIHVCDVDWNRGGTWAKGGDIVFAAGAQTALSRVSANGGPITAATRLDPGRKETSHRFPSFLPDGDHFVYVSLPGGADGFTICLASLRSRRVKVIGTSESGVTYAAPGYLVYERGRKLVARRLDLRRLELVGDAVPIAPAPNQTAEEATRVASASANGRLVALDAQSPTAHLEWFDRSGHSSGRLPVPSGDFFLVRVSNDGRFAALGRSISRFVTQIVIADLARGTETRFDAPGENNPGAWSAGDRSITITSTREGHVEEIYDVPVDGGEVRRIPTVAGQFKSPNSWSPDGATLVIDAMQPGTGYDLLAIDPAGKRAPRVLVSSPGAQQEAVISPDGRWLVYQSDETGTEQIYVCSLADGRGRQQISTASGMYPRWSRDGKEVFYIGTDFLTMYAVPVGGGASLVPGTPRALFRLPSLQSPAPSWDYSTRTDRFLMIRDDELAREPAIALWTNWPTRLGRK